MKKFIVEVETGGIATIVERFLVNAETEKQARDDYLDGILLSVDVKSIDGDSDILGVDQTVDSYLLEVEHIWAVGLPIAPETYVQLTAAIDAEMDRLRSMRYALLPNAHLSQPPSADELRPCKMNDVQPGVVLYYEGGWTIAVGETSDSQFMDHHGSAIHWDTCFVRIAADDTDE